MHLSLSSPRGGAPGCRWGNWGLCGDFAAYLCPCGGGNERPLIYYAPDYGEIWGLCFHYLRRKEIGNELSLYYTQSTSLAIGKHSLSMF